MKSEVTFHRLFNSLLSRYIDSLVDWIIGTTYKWKFQSIAIWSVGQEDMRIWGALPKQILIIQECLLDVGIFL